MAENRAASQDLHAEDCNAKAVSRRMSSWDRAQQKTPPPGGDGVFVFMTSKEEFLVLGRPGSDLLSQGLSHSTIGAEEFNGRVRDGIGFRLLARTTRPAKDKETKQAASALRSGEWGVANSE